MVAWASKALSMGESEAVRLGQNLKDRGYVQKRHDDLKSSAANFANDHTSWRFSVRAPARAVAPILSGFFWAPSASQGSASQTSRRMSMSTA